MGRGLARGPSLLFISWVCRQGEGNWSHSQNSWAPRSLSNKLPRQMLGPQEWRESQRGCLLGPPHWVQQHMPPRLCFCCCCCCLVARARAALLAGVTVPGIHRRGMGRFVAGAAQWVSGWRGKGKEGRLGLGEGETGWGWGPGRLGWQH